MNYEANNYHFMLEVMPHPFADLKLILDRKGNPAGCIFLDINPSFERMTGLKKMNVVGRSAVEIMSGSEFYHPCLLDIFSKVALTGGTVSFEQYSETMSRHYRITAYGKKENGFSVILRDITGHKETERELPAVENSCLETILASTPAIIYTYRKVDGNRIITYASENIVNVLGFTPQEIVNEPEVWAGRIHPDDIDLTGTTPEEKQTIHQEYRFICKSGICCWLHEKHNVMIGDEAKTEYIVVAWDITESKQVERLIQTRTDLLSFLDSRSPANNADRFKETLDEICDLVSSSLVFCHFVSADERTFTSKIWSTTTPGNLCTVKEGQKTQHRVDETSIWADCLRRRCPVIRNRCTFYHQHGNLPGEPVSIARALAVPVLHRGKIVAILGVGNRPLDYTERDARIVSYFADVARAVVEFRQSKEMIRYINYHDILTGLHNRAFVEQEMSRIDSEKHLPISVVVADLNGLKLVNDTYGHATGDNMLKTVAEIISNSCSGEKILARWGGDEFIVLLPRTPRGKAERLCKVIRDRCRTASAGDVPISLALGYAVKNKVTTALGEVVKKAEYFMYKRKLADRNSTKSAVLNALLKTLGAKSFETEEHSHRMKMMALEFGKILELPDSELDRLSLLITLHDIGKISIPEWILTKKGSLTREEWETIKKHPETGFRITRSTEEFAHIAEEILSHHERWDGTGYPRGLKGKQIPFLARITTIVDAFEVMTRGRPYKRKLTVEEAVEELKRCSGTQFDPNLAMLFIEKVV